MIRNERSGRWRIWHRWLSLIFGVQMVLWALSGAYMVFFDLDYIHGDHLIGDTRLSLPGDAKIAELDEVLARFPSSHSVSLKPFRLHNTTQLVYQLGRESGTMLVDAETLQIITLTKPDIRALANQYYAPEDGDIDSVVYLTDQAPSEISARLLPVWQVNYDDFGSTSFYLSATTGELLVKRHTFWRGFDFVWMLHIMDYETRADIQTWWLKGFIVGTLILMITGTVLLVYTIRFRQVSGGGAS